MAFEFPYLASELLLAIQRLHDVAKHMEQKIMVIDDLVAATAANTKAVADLQAAIAAHPGLDLTPVAAAAAQIATNNTAIEAAVAALTPPPPAA